MVAEVVTLLSVSLSLSRLQLNGSASERHGIRISQANAEETKTTHHIPHSTLIIPQHATTGAGPLCESDDGVHMHAAFYSVRHIMGCGLVFARVFLLFSSRPRRPTPSCLLLYSSYSFPPLRLPRFFLWFNLVPLFVTWSTAFDLVRFGLGHLFLYLDAGTVFRFFVLHLWLCRDSHIV